MISIHLKDGKLQDVAGIPEGEEVAILEITTGEETILTAKDNIQ